MGLNVTTDLNEFKGKTLVAYNFNGNNENIIYMLDSKGIEYRYRIPAVLRDMLYDFMEASKFEEAA